MIPSPEPPPERVAEEKAEEIVELLVREDASFQAALKLGTLAL